MEVKKFNSTERTDLAIIYIHGGPYFQIKKSSDDPYLEFLVTNYPIVFCPNYTINLNARKFEKRIGLSDIQKFVNKIKGKYSRIVIIGDSYGGYLASLFSADCNIDKVIVISGFISLYYQSIFSKEWKLIQSIFKPNDLDWFNLYQNKKNITPTYFIQGTVDNACPVQQFEVINNEFNGKIFKLSGFTHREISTNKINLILSILKKLI